MNNELAASSVHLRIHLFSCLFAVHIKNLYCYLYTSSSEDLPKSSGWDFFKLENEYRRMRVPNDQWTLCTLNQNYELCDTYPRQVYVPSEATTTMLMGSSRFRSKGRLPALTYLHSNKVLLIYIKRKQILTLYDAFYISGVYLSMQSTAFWIQCTLFGR